MYIELPKEDAGREGGRMMGMLNKAMYGLRDAPQVWQEEVRRILGGLGFHECKTSPCVFVNQRTSLRIVTHVDDFLCVGPDTELKQFYQDLSHELELKCEILGDGPDCASEGRFLGRTIKWTKHGITWQGDERMVHEMLKEWEMEGCNSVGTPCSKEEGCMP